MHPSIIITDLNGSPRLDQEQLPLNVGTGHDAHIRLPEWEGTGSFAQIALLDDRCFVQPQNPDIKLKLNGVSLVKPNWLQDGDVLSVGDAEIELHDDGEELEFEVFLSSEEAETIPPEPGSGVMTAHEPGGDPQPPQPASAASPPQSAVDLVARAVAERNTRMLKAAEPASGAESQVDALAPREPLLELDPPSGAAAADPMAALPGENSAAPPTPPQQPAASRQKRSKLVWFCWLALLFVIAYVGLSSKVAVGTFPADAAVSMEPRWLAPGRAGRFFVLPGEYRYVVSAPGYQQTSGTLSVGFLERKSVNVELPEKPGRLSFRLPEGLDGELFIDGELFAQLSELPVALPKGTHAYRIVSDLYKDYAGEVDIIGRDQLQVLRPELSPEWGSFAVATTPPGAEIYFGDQLLGTTPATVDVKAGRHELELRLPGYQPMRTPVNSVAGEVEILPVIELTQLGSSIALTTSPPGAAVTAGADYLGVTPLTIEAIPDQPLVLTIARNGFEPVTREVKVGENEVAQIDVALVARTGTVVVEATPLDAQLFVDGKLVGLANQELTLPAVAHDIEIRSAGFQTWASRITPTPGIPQRIDVSLLTEAQARLANLPSVLETSMQQRLVLVKPGTLTLGATSGAQGRRANEVIREVELTRPFYIGTTEVTNRQFARFNGRHSSATPEYPGLDGPEQPVVNVSWSEAAAYCNWLSDREGLPRAYVMVDDDLRLAEPPNTGYRLPTEAEWAWVARFNGGLGNERRFSWGSAMPPIDNAGNYADASAIDFFPNAILGYTDGAVVTAKVASYEPNPLGVFDLGGNVAEWTNDYYSSAASTGVLIDPLGPATGPGRVIRGSSWRESTVSDLRLVARDFGTDGQVDIGFRLARYAPQIEVTESDE